MHPFQQALDAARAAWERGDYAEAKAQAEKAAYIAEGEID